MKTIKLIAICFCLSAFQGVVGQNALPKAYQISTDTISTVTLTDSLWQFVEDKSATWTIDSVRQLAYGNKFQFAFADTKHNLMQNFWIRYRLKNKMDKEAKIALRFFSAGQCDMYLLGTDGSGRHLLSGTNIVWSKRDGIKFNNLNGNNFIPISILPNEELIVYIKTLTLLGINKIQLSIQLYSIEKMNTELSLEAEQNYFRVMSDSFFFGFVFLAFFFNFLFYLISKERIYLYFSLYVFSLGFVRITDELYHLFFRESYSILLNTRILALSVSQPSFAYFLRNLLNMPAKHPSLNRILLILIYIHFSFMLLIRFVHHNFIISWLSIGTMISLSYYNLFWWFLLVILFLYSRPLEKSVRKIIFAILPAFSIWVICWSILTISYEINRLFNVPFLFFYKRLAENWRTVEIVCLLWIVVCFSWFLLNNFSKLKRKIIQKELDAEIERSQLIEEQNSKLEDQVAHRTNELNKSLENLKSTQTQLIQKEKMASLGELSAGIAHEIQNPLNFVNNFSEVSTELVDELRDGPFTHLPEAEKEYAAEIMNDLNENLQKITKHGQRASNIVKGMLEHSRTSTGERQPTDLNALADECLRLAYQGVRAKNQAFNCELVTDFDPNVGVVEVVPPDIWRVLLNLFNNAFYAVGEKQKTAPPAYQPRVSVSTRLTTNQVAIHVKDNGTGLSELVEQKLFQPFFTTKPPGEGTGLGLSLSYDIVTKGHQGSLRVETQDGEGTEFIIQLPTATVSSLA